METSEKFLRGCIHGAIGADDPYLGGNHGVVHHLSGPAHRRGSGYRGGHGLSGRHAPRHCADVRSDDTGFRHPFRDAACGQDTVFPVDAGFSPGHMEHPAGRRPGYCPSDAGACRYMDVRNEPEQHQYRHRDLVHCGGGLCEKQF